MSKELLFSVRTPGQYRVAVIRDGRPEQVYVDPAPATRVGNLYEGRIVNIERSLQALHQSARTLRRSLGQRSQGIEQRFAGSDIAIENRQRTVAGGCGEEGGCTLRPAHVGEHGLALRQRFER